MLHTFQPESILLSIGNINIFWYGVFMTISMIMAGLITIKLAKYYKIKTDIIIDLSFWLIIFGIIGARFYHIGLEFNYYYQHPLEMFKIWRGGIAIHGGIIVGLIVLWVFSKKQKINFWILTSLIAPGLALGQSIGRWGNYFNQELFGIPTTLPWGIPIDTLKRPAEYFSNEFFHPTFLYESFGNFLIFLILILFHVWIIKKQKSKEKFCFLLSSSYLILYSILRFSLEFIRIDNTPVLFNLRFPQIASLIIVIFTIIVFIKFNKKNKLEIKNSNHK